VDIRNDHARGSMAILATALLFTLGCATPRYDAHGNLYYESYDHRHATEGAVLGGLAGAGVGRAIAGHDYDEAGYWIGGALGVLAGAVVGDAMDREEDRARHAPYPSDPPAPPHREPPRDDGWDDDRHDYEPDEPYGYEPPRSPGPLPPGPLLLNLPDEVLFAPGSARLEPGAKRRLRSVAVALRRHSQTVAVVRGHTSRSERREDVLSEARSRVVRDYLLDQGVAASRVIALGMGARFPLASDRTAEGQQRNRRAEIEIRSDRGHDQARLW